MDKATKLLMCGLGLVVCAVLLQLPSQTRCSFGFGSCGAVTYNPLGNLADDVGQLLAVGGVALLLLGVGGLLMGMRRG